MKKSKAKQKEGAGIGKSVSERRAFCPAKKNSLEHCQVFRKNIEVKEKRSREDVNGEAKGVQVLGEKIEESRSKSCTV